MTAAPSATPFPERRHGPGPALRHRRRPPWAGRRSRRLLLAVTAVASVLAGSGTALAYYSSSGEGSGRAAAGSPSVTVESPPVTGLHPGASRTVTVNLRNDAPRPYVVTAVTPRVSAAPGSCPAALWVMVPTPLPTVLASGDAAVDLTVGMGREAPDDCQGVTVTVPLDIEGRLG